MSNIYSIVTKKPISIDELKAHRKSFPQVLNTEIEQLLAFVEYSLYALSLNGFAINDSILLVPLDDEDTDTLAVMNVNGTKDTKGQRSMIKTAYRCVKRAEKEEELKNENDDSQG